MIKGYTRPQLLIRQILDILPDAEEKTLNAFVLGPQYDLFRYTNEDERSVMTGAAFVENTAETKADTFTDPDFYQKVSYEGLRAHHIVDRDYTRLYGEQLEGQLWAAKSNFNEAEGEDPNEFEFKLISLITPNKIKAHRRGAMIAVTHVSYSGNGYLSNPQVTYPGTGYPASVTFDFPVPGGSGSGAIVRLTTDVNGQVSSAEMAAPGWDYLGSIEPFEVTTNNVGANVGVQDGTPEENYGDSTLVPQLYGRPIKPGDIMYVTNELEHPTRVRRTVRTVEREKVASHYGTNLDTDKSLLADDQTLQNSLLNPLETSHATFGNTSHPANWDIDKAPGSNPSDWNGMSQGANFGTNTTNDLENVQYDNQYGERYTITVTKGGFGTVPRVRIRSASGAFSSNNANATQELVESGVTTASQTGTTITLVGGDYTFEMGVDAGKIIKWPDGSIATIDHVTDATHAEATVSQTVDADSFTVTGFNYLVDHAALGGLKVILIAPDAATPLRLGDVFTFVIIGAYKPLELGATGTILTIEILTGGTGYSVGDTTLTIEAPPEDADPRQLATGTCTIAGGIVTTATIVIPGKGYKSAPNVTVESSSGTGATFRTTISTPETSRDLSLVQNLTYRGRVDTRYIIKVIKGGVLLNTTDTPEDPCVVEVSDNAGIDRIQTYEITQGTKYDLGTYGLQFVFPAEQTIGDPASATFSTGEGGELTSIDSVTGGAGYTSAPRVVIAGTPADSHSVLPVAHAVVDDSGAVSEVIIDEPGSGYGDLTLTIDPPRRFLRTGDTYYVDAISEKAAGPYSIIVLNGQATDITGWTELDLAINKFDIDVRVLHSGIILPKRDTAPVKAWLAGTAADGGIFVKDTLRLFIAERYEDHQWVTVRKDPAFTSDAPYSKLFAHWRALVPATSGDKIRLYGTEDAIKLAFGIEDYDNPVCYGALTAFRGAQEKPVFVVKIATNDLAGYATMIRQAENIEGIYAIAPTGYELEVGQALKTHVDKMSIETWKLWRRVYLGYQNPGPYVVMDDKDDGTPYIATVTSNAAGNVRVICTDGDFITRGIRPGDLFRISFRTDEWGDPAYDEYVIYNVLEEDELILESGPASPISPAINFQIWRPNNGLSQCEWAGERAEFYSDRRVINVWCDTPQQTDANGEVQHPPVYFLACEVAGLRSAVLPQQGLTYTELQHSLDACPLMFTKYTQEEMDVAGAKGVFIIKQDHEDGPIYIRHQLTTDTNHGILYYEDSVGTNLDNISYVVKALLTPYPGKRNANPEVLEELETKMRGTLNEFMRNPGGYTNIGPALIRWTNLKIWIDKVFKDRINIEVDLELPLPINTLLVKLRGRTIQEDLIISTEILVANPNL